MTAETKPRRKKWKIAGGILLTVLVLLAGGFFWYELFRPTVPRPHWVWAGISTLVCWTR